MDRQKKIQDLQFELKQAEELIKVKRELKGALEQEIALLKWEIERIKATEKKEGKC